jgi:hypothetical protein
MAKTLEEIKGKMDELVDIYLRARYPDEKTAIFDLLQAVHETQWVIKSLLDYLIEKEKAD